MRHIKFRVWDKDHKLFLPDEVYDIHSRTSFNSFGIMRKDWRNYSEGEYFYDNAQILELYTGLKDKNGKEIYEGDILNGLMYNSSFCLGKVVFEDGCFVSESLTGENWITNITPQIAEIIGNIHENPELIK